MVKGILPGAAGGLQKDMSIGNIVVFERAIRDILSEPGWKQGYHSEEKLEGLKQIVKAALDTLVKN